MTIALSRRSLLGAASAGTALGIGGVRAVAQPPAKPLFGPGSGVAWLTYNENPYGPSPRAIQAMADAAPPTRKADFCLWVTKAGAIFRPFRSMPAQAL